MKTCKHCKKQVSEPHQCENTGGFVTDLADFIGDAFNSIFSSGGDSGGDSGCDSGGGCD